jgi:phage terminase small subunit
VNPQQLKFVHAYLGEANGNGTKAAISAGYSQRSASVIASQLLRRPDVRDAIEKRLDKADIRTDAILKRLGRIVHSEPKDITTSDVIGASKLLLQVNGALKDKASDSRITVNIGFLQAAPPKELPAISIETVEADADRD